MDERLSVTPLGEPSSGSTATTGRNPLVRRVVAAGLDVRRRAGAEHERHRGVRRGGVDAHRCVVDTVGRCPTPTPTAHHHHHAHADASRGVAGLRIALGLSLGIFVVEFAGGLIGGSLALMADAGHMLADVGALSLALVAAWVAQRPPSGRRTFGWQRAEILAALANGLILILIVIATVIEAFRRLESPTSVAGGITLAVATIGLAFNIVSGVVLARSGDSLNIRAALAHVIADALSSVGVIVAALVIITTGWTQADAIASLVIAG